MRNTVLLLALGLSAGLCLAEDRFLLPEGDLPEARVCGYRVAFTRNGACVLARDGKWLLDAGLGFATKGWKIWGTQVRRAGYGDGWNLTEESALRFEGTLFDFERVPRFHFAQEVSVTPVGLHFKCDIRKLQVDELEGIGLVVQTPVKHAVSGAMRFRPGFSTVNLPAKHTRARIGTSSATGCSVEFPAGWYPQFAGMRNLRWVVLDDRQWDLSVFRSVGWDPVATRQLNTQGEASFSYDLVLAAPLVATLVDGDVECIVDAHTRVLMTDNRRTFLEGGVARWVDGADWSFGTSRPVDSPDEGFASVVDVDESEVRCQASLIDEETGAKLVYRLGPQVREGGGPETVLALAVPVGAIIESESLLGRDSNTRVRELRLQLKSGSSVRLVAEGGWKMTKGKYAGSDCYVFGTAFLPREDGDMEATVTVSVVATETGELRS